MRSVNLDFAWELDPDDEGRAWPFRHGDDGLDRIIVNGVSLFVYALRVRWTSYVKSDLSIVKYLHTWSEAFAHELVALSELHGGAVEELARVELPGLQGEWVIMAYPEVA